MIQFVTLASLFFYFSLFKKSSMKEFSKSGKNIKDI